MFKAYIITTPCSGKTSFVLQYNRSYNDISLIDQDNVSSMLVRTGIIRPNAHENKKANTLIEFLKTRKESSILLGSYLPSNPLDYPEITIICVILPKLKQLYYVVKRRLLYAMYHKLSIFPAYKDFVPNKKWSIWPNISEYRNRILVYSSDHDIPVFKNFQQAVSMLNQL
ncbi:MAG: hypothetical protein GY941_19965 [Planctomycetes bacterium]|nr:hypothetical protein [Planctomycetota bacterium]